ncbi:hypothetical protein ACFV2N_26680 [Streptomyces sp. NPDC059680]|uniref:hypothetical protein n=1 Tax=Streptomyces sp. NPDC059680 TaxID=3346904 RepID=UPI00368F6C65
MSEAFSSSRSELAASPVDGPPPPGEHFLDLLDVLQDNGAIALESLTANPDPVTPCGGPPSTLSWRITKHSNLATTDEQRRVLPHVGFTLSYAAYGEVRVQATGTRDVHPSLTTSYTLYAALGPARFPLGIVIVRIDESSCSTASITADLLRQLVKVYVDQFVGQYGLRLRSPVGLDITENGIHVHLAILSRQAININVDIDLVFQLYAKDCGIHLLYVRSNVDVDLPWWLDPGIVIAGEELIGDIIDKKLKSELLNQLQNFLNSFLPSSLCVCRATLTRGEVSILTCPR